MGYLILIYKKEININYFKKIILFVIKLIQEVFGILIILIISILFKIILNKIMLQMVQLWPFIKIKQNLQLFLRKINFQKIRQKSLKKFIK